jgi:NAD(P)-dependent dehydrogenase (short-subunit alcohol dehydrogenase family)
MTGRFEGKAAIVTGSSSGIGKATALRLAREGASVCIVADRNVEGGQATAAEVAEGGGRAVFVRANVASAEDCRRVAERTGSELGRVDVLVNNAGITRREPFPEATEELWDRVVNVNLKGAFLMSRAVVGDMLRQGGGAIVHVSSVHAEQTHGPFAAYAASKAGLCGLTRAMALELGPRGLRVNCILPGTIDVKLYPREDRESVDRDAWRPRRSDAQVLGRFGSPDEIAAAIAFLASDDASFVNGAALVADGGLLCKLGDGFG